MKFKHIWESLTQITFQGLPGDKGMTGPPGPHGMSVSKYIGQKMKEV